MRRLIKPGMLAAAFLASVLMYFNLPERVPLHWNLRGEVDRWGSPTELLFLMPVIMLVVWALLIVLPKLAPLRAKYANFSGTYETMTDVILAIFLACHVFVLTAVSGAVQIQIYARVITGIALIIVGTIMPRARQNWFLGVRTPWTLDSARVWEQTQRIAGYLFVAVGVIALLTIRLAAQIAIPLIAALIIEVAIGTGIYSYVLWTREQNGQTP